MKKMKMYRKIMKKRRALALLLTLMLVMAPAFGSYAKEQEENPLSDKAVSEQEIQAVTGDPEAVPASDGSGEGPETKTDSPDEVTPDKKTETPDNPEKASSEGDAQAGEKQNVQGAAANARVNTSDTGSDENVSKTSAEDPDFESTPPEIQKIELEKNGLSIKNDEALKLTIQVYDDSAIDYAEVIVMSEVGSIPAVRAQKVEITDNPNEYRIIWEYPPDKVITGKLWISHIKVVDIYSNEKTFMSSNYQNPEYWVNAEASEESGTIHVDRFTFPNNHASAETINEIMEGMELTTKEAIEDQNVYLDFRSEDGGSAHLWLGLSDGKNSYAEIDNPGGYVSEKGTYTLDSIYVQRGQFYVKIPLEIEDKESYGFTLTRDPDSRPSEIQAELVSVDMDKNGQKVSKGDKVNITVKVADNSGAALPESGYVQFRTVAPDVDHCAEQIDLKLGENQEYHGTLTIGDLYPSEWYISSIGIGEGGRQLYTDWGNGLYYIKVYEGKTFINPAFNLNIEFNALDENGDFQCISKIRKEKVERRQTLKELKIAFPEVKTSYQGLKFEGWVDREGRSITEDTQIVDGNLQVYAKYDKGVVAVNYRYPDDQGNWNSAVQKHAFEYGQKYGEFIKSIQEYAPEDITKDAKLAGWEYNDFYHNDSDVLSDRIINVTAKFDDVAFIDVRYRYYDQEGNDCPKREPLKVDEGTKIGDVITRLNNTEPPESYPGLRFNHWNTTMYLDGAEAEPVKNGQEFVVNAVYDNCIVRYIIQPMKSGDLMWTAADRIFCQIAEKGEKVTALKSFGEFGGIKDIQWGVSLMGGLILGNGSKTPSETFVVNEDMTFKGIGHYPAEPDNPDKPDDTTKPTDPAKPSDPTQGSTSNQRPSGGSTSNGSPSGDGQNPGVTPDSKLPDSVVNSVIEAVNAAEPGQNLTVNMNGSTAISKEILEAARGKDVNLTLQMDGYSWTINGRTIQSVELKDIDLRVIKNTQNIPSATVRELAGNNPCMQLTLAHEGSFGFQATLTVGVGAEYAGRYGNLYYHDSAGKMVFINAGQIDANGNVSLIFSHASDYLLVMSDKMMSQADVPSQLMPSDVSLSQNGSASASGVSNNTEKSVKTGDSDMAFPWILLCIAAAGTMVYMFRKKQA